MAYRQPPNGYSGDDRDMGRDDRSDRMDKHNTHLIEHLATFTVTPETGINYPADGMRRLLQLEKSNGIWSQKMLLCLDHSWVLIMDYETGTEMERFPANSIQEPTPFMSNDPMEMYNNILVFIVTNSNPNHPPEMHIFQCQRISAQDLAEDLKQLRSGKTLTRTHRSTIPPPTHKPPQNIINASREHNSRDYHGSDSELTANNDDSSSTTSEKYERDVSVLNHCFDDIEKFIAKLQHIDAAKTELARRQKNRKSKKPHSGDGMLSMRTKSPPPKEFVDIFQKFKLSFNLLAKLKMHIHDPNAPELVHFLFTPLALIVESSQVTYYDQQIAHNVVAPLLTREAVNLLMNCVTSKETELWHSLGPAWQIPRDQYKAAVPPYHPTFLDGFSPEYPIVDELDPSMDNKNFGDNLDGQYSSDYHDYPQSHQDNALMFENDHTHLPPTMGDSIRSDISVDSIETKGMEDRGFGRNQESFLEELQARGANIVCVTYPRTANNDKELTVVRGEILEILDDTRKWWKAKNSKGQVAHVPHTIVTPNINHNPLYAQQYRKRPQESPNHHDGHGSNVHDHHINNMSPSKNSAEKIRNEHIDSKPPQPPSAMFNRPLPPPISTMPPPPPPPGAGPPPPPPPMSGAPPPPPPPGNMPISSVRPASQPPQPPTTPSSTLKRSPSVRSSYYEELATVITTVKDRQRKKRIEIKQTPEIYIYSKSTPAEVQEWLKKKGFDHNKCERISDMNGQNLFDFQKVELVQIFGDKEGKRLYSQLSIQKSISGYKTTSTTELQSFLAKARQKVEPGD